MNLSYNSIFGVEFLLTSPHFLALLILTLNPYM